MTQDLEPYTWCSAAHLTTFCITGVRRLTPDDLFERWHTTPGDHPELAWASANDATDARAMYAAIRVATVEDWTVAIELSSSIGANESWLDALSRSTEAWSILRGGDGMDLFLYMRDDALVTGFEPLFPNDRRGTEPDHFTGAMTTVGLLPADRGALIPQSLPRTLRMIALVFGVQPTEDLVENAVLPVGFVDEPPATYPAHQPRSPKGLLP